MVGAVSPESHSVLTTCSDIQKKIVPWTNPAAAVNELFPDCLPGKAAASIEEPSKGGLVLVASLLNKAPNIGGKLECNVV